MAKTSKYEHTVSTLEPEAGNDLKQWLVFEILVLERQVHIQIKGTAYL